MKKIFLLALLVNATIAFAQDVKLNFTEGNEPSHFTTLPAKEVRQISHSVDENGAARISIDMLNGPTFEYDAAAIQGIDNTLPEDLSQYNNGDLLEIIHEYNYVDDQEFCNTVYGTEGMRGYLGKVMRGMLAILAFSSGDYQNPYTLNYHVYDISYVSTDYDGQKIRLSGRVFFPYTVDDERDLLLSRVFLENHFTTFEDAQSPTTSFYNQPMSAMMAKGYLVVQPDLMGFGVSSSRSQLFVDQKLMPRHIADCLLATMQLVEKTNTEPDMVRICLNPNATILNEGASQGAASAMAFQRFYENNLTPAELEALPPLGETRVCAGPYNPWLTFEEYCRWDKLYYSATVPMLMQGAVINHGDLMVYSDKKPILLDDLFSEKMKIVRFPQYDNLNIWEIINTKKYNSYEIMDALWSTFGNVEEEWASVRAMLKEGIVNPLTGALNTSDPRVRAIKKVLSESDNTMPTWHPRTKLSMFHGDHDDIVPYSNSYEFYRTMSYVFPDADITFETLNDEGLGNHVTVCGYWILSEILGISFDDTITLLREAGVIE